VAFVYRRGIMLHTESFSRHLRSIENNTQIAVEMPENIF